MQEEHPPWIRIVHNKDWLPPGDDFYEAEFPPPYAPAAATGWEIFMLLAGILLGVLIATKGHADDTPPPAIVQPNDSAHGRPPLSGSGCQRHGVLALGQISTSEAAPRGLAKGAFD